MPMPARFSFSLAEVAPRNPSTAPGTTIKAAVEMAAPPRNWRRESFVGLDFDCGLHTLAVCVVHHERSRTLATRQS